MRFGIAWIGQEQSTVHPAFTGMAAFRAQGLRFGRQLIEQFAGAGMSGGFLDAVRGRRCSDQDVDLVLLVKATAVPGGRVSASTLDKLTRYRVRSLRAVGGMDALAPPMYGARCAEGVDDVGRHLLSAARTELGHGTPIMLGLDHHADITTEMIRLSDATVGQRTQPHQPFDAGALLGGPAGRPLEGSAHPTMTWLKPRLISDQEQYLTASAPTMTRFDRARNGDPRWGSAAVSPFPMQPWPDAQEGGWPVVVVTDGDPDLGGCVADDLPDLAWSLRDDFPLATGVPVSAALARGRRPCPGVAGSQPGACHFALDAVVSKTRERLPVPCPVHTEGDSWTPRGPRSRISRRCCGVVSRARSTYWTRLPPGGDDRVSAGRSGRRVHRLGVGRTGCRTTQALSASHTWADGCRQVDPQHRASPPWQRIRDRLDCHGQATVESRPLRWHTGGMRRLR